MTTTLRKSFFGLVLVLLALPAWAGSIGLDIGSGGKISFKGNKNAVMATGTILDFSAGKQLFPATGHFSFTTGRFLSSTSNEWFFGSGGHLNFGGCIDSNSDLDAHCDKKDLSGRLSGTFNSAKIIKTGNTYTLSGQVSLTVTPALAAALGIKNGVPLLANITLNFTDSCIPTSRGCAGSITRGALSVSEPTSLVLLGLGMLMTGLAHSTLLSFFRAQA